MIPAHRFVGVYVQKRMLCFGKCCCTPVITINFSLTNNEEVEFVTSGTISAEDSHAIFKFVYGAIEEAGFGAKAHSLAILSEDGVLRSDVVTASLNVALDDRSASPPQINMFRA